MFFVKLLLLISTSSLGSFIKPVTSASRIARIQQLTKTSYIKYSIGFLNMAEKDHLETNLSNQQNDILYDVPVSNHGARIRIIIKEKKIDHLIDIKSPENLGGMKSPAYLDLNMQGKIPLFLTTDGNPIPESDTIARYVLDRFPQSPSFIPMELHLKSLSDLISRLHDIYLSPVQGVMYKAHGTSFGIFGTDRKAGLAELLHQLQVIETTVNSFYKRFPHYKGRFLCGNQISLGDASLFPTIVFCNFMLPKVFGLAVSDFLGDTLRSWFEFLSSEVESTKCVREEIEGGLRTWEANGRFIPIVEELKL